MGRERKERSARRRHIPAKNGTRREMKFVCAFFFFSSFLLDLITTAQNLSPPLVSKRKKRQGKKESYVHSSFFPPDERDLSFLGSKIMCAVPYNEEQGVLKVKHFAYFSITFSLSYVKPRHVSRGKEEEEEEGGTAAVTFVGKRFFSRKEEEEGRRRGGAEDGKGRGRRRRRVFALISREYGIRREKSLYSSFALFHGWCTLYIERHGFYFYLRRR